MKLKRTIFPTWLLIVATAATVGSVDGYITSGLPKHVHQAWLKKMTSDICDASPGDLTPEMCIKAPQLLSAWAQNPYVSHTYGNKNINSSSSSSPARHRRRGRNSITNSDNKSNHASNSSINNVDFPHHGRECALAAEQILKRMVDERRAGNENAIATTDDYNACLEIWARSGEGVFAAQRAEQILMAMQDMYNAGDTNVQPNTQSFRSVILAWIKAGNKDESMLHRAQQILEWMIHLNKMGDNDKAVPDEECFNIILRGWAYSHHSDAPHKTEELLMVMDQLHSEGLTSATRPSTIHFNQVLLAWSKSSSNTAAQRAQDILDHMEQLSSKNVTIQNDEESQDTEKTFYSVEPDCMSYSIVCATWAKSDVAGAVEKAENILRKMESKALETGKASLNADTITYNIVIDAWAKNKSCKTSYQRARALIDRQINLFNNVGIKKCRPDVYGFTSVIASCASVKSMSWKEKAQAFDVALATFHELESLPYDRPNHVTYGTMLKACSKLLQAGSKQRNRNVRTIFRSCCSKGCAGYMVFNRLKQAASPKLYKQLVGEYEKHHTEWTSNIPQIEKEEIYKKPPEIFGFELIESSSNDDKKKER